VIASPNNAVWTKNCYLGIPLKMMPGVYMNSQILPENIIAYLFEADIEKFQVTGTQTRV